jgi:hypothetical protein
MTVIRLLRRCVNQTRIRRGVLRFELADAFEVSRVGDNRRELLDLFELVQLRVTCLLLMALLIAFLSSIFNHTRLRFVPHRPSPLTVCE